MSYPSESSGPTASRSWKAFQCPTCSGLFRAPSCRQGEAAGCPLCQATVRLSRPGLQPDRTQAMRSTTPQRPSQGALEKTYREADIDQDQPETGSGTGKGQLRKRRNHSIPGGLSAVPDWEASEGERTRRDDGIPWLSVLGVFTVLGVIAAGGISYYQKQSSAEISWEDTNIRSTAEDVEALEAVMALTEIPKEDTLESDAVEAVENFQKFDLVKIKALIQSFTEAKTVEEKARFAREPDQALPRMEAYYRHFPYSPEGFRSFDEREVSYRGSFISSSVQLEDFTNRHIAIQKVGDGSYAVDWESWVGFSETPVDQLKRLRPTEPTVMRAQIRPLDYYNYDFSDEAKWKSFRLTFADPEKALWGYAQRGSEVYQALTGDPSYASVVTIRYPENARTGDQVEIVERLIRGWVLHDDLKMNDGDGDTTDPN